MGKRRLSMRKIREVLKLKLGGGLSDRQVAGALGISPATVGDLVRRASAAGITWPLAEDMGDDALEALLYPRQEKDTSRPLPDMAYLHRELARKGVTLALLWEEYAAEHPQDHYSYPQLARRYRAWRDGLDVSMRQVHKAGERMYSDFAGEKLRIVDAKTGEISCASLFVAAMGFSSYTYAEAFPSEQLPCWIAGHVNAISFFGAAPHIITPEARRPSSPAPAATSLTSTAPSPRWPPTTDVWSSRRGCANRRTKRKWRTPSCRRSAGSWRPCATALSSPWPRPTRP